MCTHRIPRPPRGNIKYKYKNIKASIGLRFYDQNGDKELDDGRKYFGFGKIHDEHEELTSAKIRKYDFLLFLKPHILNYRPGTFSKRLTKSPNYFSNEKVNDA